MGASESYDATGAISPPQKLEVVLFAQALEKASDKRAAFLEGACQFDTSHSLTWFTQHLGGDTHGGCLGVTFCRQ